MLKKLVYKILGRIGSALMQNYRPLTELDLKCSPQIKVSQVTIYNFWRNLVRSKKNLPSLSEAGFRVFSQFEEDGLLLYIFSIIGMGSRRFIDIGAADGINSNCANFVIHWGWHGLFIDGDQNKVSRGEGFYANQLDTLLFPPKFCCSRVTAENINTLISDSGFSEKRDIELLSIDIDGNDYWVWKALEVVSPKVVIIETHIEFALHPIVVPYDPDYSYPGKYPHYHGASIKAMAKLAEEKGYRLIGSNLYGFNTIWIKKGLVEKELPTVSIEKILEHPRNAQRAKLFKAIEKQDYIKI